MKKIIRSLAKNICLYLLTALNIIYAIEHQTFGWLFWVSIVLTSLATVLNVICAVRENRKEQD